MLIGVPGETVKDFKDTIHVLRESLPASVFLSIYFPYPGTDLYAVTSEENLLNEKISVGAERRSSTLDRPEFSRKRIKYEYLMFWYNVFHGIWSPRKIIAWTVYTFILSYPRMYAFYKFMVANNRLIRYMQKASKK